MNAFDEQYIFRLATVDDTLDIMNFIKAEWEDESILATNRECFCLQYQNGDVINVLLAIHKQSGKIEAMPQKPNVACASCTELIKINGIDELDGRFDFEYDKNRIPYKDKWYIKRRYFEHPVYDYMVWALRDKTEAYGGLLFCREVTQNGAKALKIIDYLGDIQLIAGLESAFGKILETENYEYIDLYCAGVEDELLYAAGFSLRTETDPNIIPNYFEPFVQKNIEIRYHTDNDKALFFRGDADRDRPYIWKTKRIGS
ncbi:hypothetical protein FACS1894111_12280 [Clostridia bacterium]|nr:hypothetical protein FACS1894111_12280 [Clostridia bacterium]